MEAIFVSSDAESSDPGFQMPQQPPGMRPVPDIPNTQNINPSGTHALLPLNRANYTELSLNQAALAIGKIAVAVYAGVWAVFRLILGHCMSIIVNSAYSSNNRQVLSSTTTADA